MVNSQTLTKMEMVIKNLSLPLFSFTTKNKALLPARNLLFVSLNPPFIVLLCDTELDSIIFLLCCNIKLCQWVLWRNTAERRDLSPLFCVYSSVLGPASCSSPTKFQWSLHGGITVSSTTLPSSFPGSSVVQFTCPGVCWQFLKAHQLTFQ